MSQTGILYKMPLDDTETYEDWPKYLHDVIPDADKRYFEFTFKESTSLISPTIIINADFVDLAQYNYLSILFKSHDDEIYQNRYYYITDIITVRYGVSELILKMDIIRTIDWVNSGTQVKLKYTTNRADWSTTCDDPRWEPYRAYKNNGTIVDEFNSGLPEGNGIYAVKWWWGDENDGDPYGVVCGLFDETQFNKFIFQVNNYIANHPSAILSGITDFTKFIISAKFIPGLDVYDCAVMGGGYQRFNVVGVGGLASITSTCYVKKDKFGAINSWLDGSVDPEDHYITVKPLGVGHTAAEIEDFKKLKFLLTPKWCQMTVRTPVGVGAIDLSTFQNLDRIYYSTILDLESGIMTMNFFRVPISTTHVDLTNIASMDMVLSLSSTVFYDVIDHFTHIQNPGEVAIQSVGQGAMTAMSAGAMTGNYTLGAGVGLVQSLAGASNEIMSGRNINQPYASTGNDLFWLHLNEESLVHCVVKTTIFLNPDTPLGGEDKSQYILWDAANVDQTYRFFCNQPYHGYPSIKYTDLHYTTGMAAGNTWIQCSEVHKIGHGSGIIPTPEMEEEIKRRLLQGIYIHANRI